ncbi:uncharacterized protein ColSpa_03131 [Colletotrichum spaethianum]|uniref:Uncharacterized protein n=1 Tax=Colletotrichum spaethianum TaxID=700344 RepID=A0AA37NY15_9PEZI|nr:uncharacterized protein ColSpa_03131 [Colletotrichum spaethianum]GKT42950.1 hypothetical protein ColSpa_03131 [Colletotrichum spaethianum]
MYLTQHPWLREFLAEEERKQEEKRTAKKKKQMDDIRALSADQARSVLVALCHDERIRRDAVFLSRKLRKAEEAQTTQDAGSGSGSARSAICVQCNAVFNPTENNGREDCQYHPGFFALHWDDDFWADEDQDERAIDTVEYREAFPDGFKWTCCDRVGQVRGCCKGPHEADPCKSRRKGKFGFVEGNLSDVQEVKEHEEDGNSDEDEVDENEDDDDDDEPEVQFLGEQPCNKRKAEDDGGPGAPNLKKAG